MVCLTRKKNDTNVISEALKALGKENLALIVHGSSFPACDGEDTGFGSFNSDSGHALIDYASKIFNAIQLGPAGKTKASDSSPYCGTIFSGNPLFIDLHYLYHCLFELFFHERHLRLWRFYLILNTFQNQLLLFVKNLLILR